MDEEMTKKRKSRTKSTDVMNQKKYQCHCGRKYLSYSALYIHSKQKHGITITTKNFETREGTMGTRSRVVNSQSQNNGQPCENQQPTEQFQNIERVIVRYLNKSKPNSDKTKLMYWTFEQLISCINNNANLLEEYILMTNYTEKKTPALVPLIFNFFLVDFCPKTLGVVYENSKEKMKEIIYDFGQWLFDNRLTQYETRPNVQLQVLE